MGENLSATPDGRSSKVAHSTSALGFDEAQVLTMFGGTGKAFAKTFGIKAIVDKTEGIAALTESILKALAES